jgi:hypothetical protein
LLHQIHRLQEKEPDHENSSERQIALKALNSVRSSPMAEISRRDANGEFTALEQLVGDLKMALWELSDALTSRYFSNLTACRFTTSL